MKRKMKWINLLTVVALLAVSMASLGVVGAQDDTPPGQPGQGRQGRQEPPQDPTRHLIGLIVGVTTLNPQEVLEEIANGATPASLLEAQGIDVEAVIVWLVSGQAVHLNRAVALGSLTRADADAKLAEIEETIRGLMSGALPLQPRNLRQTFALDMANTVAETLDITPQALAAQVAGGKTLTEIIEASGADPEAVAAAIVAAESEKIAQAVADGKLEQARADEMLEGLPDLVQMAMEGRARFGDRPGMPGGANRPGVDLMRDVMDAVSEATGLTPRELLQQARNEGKSLAEILEASGADVEAITAIVTTNAGEKIAQAVADAKLTQEQADELLETLDQFIDRMMNRVPGKRPGRGGAGRGNGN